MGGYNGKILRADLSRMSLIDEPLTYELARKYIGGAGLVAYFLWKELKAGVDALGPENKLIFALGPVTGLHLPGASRYCAGAKSPLTGGIAKSESGGFWMAEMKRAGYDAIIIEGKADKPVYLWINDGQAYLKDAGHLWGKEVKETQEALRGELGDKRVQVASIGPAGEHQVRYACIMTGLLDACGRGGLGAVMGSKNLKAIAVRGHKLPEVANPDYIKTLRSTLLAQKHPLSEYGTGGPEMIMHEQEGDLPVHNQRDGLFPKVGEINGVAIKETIRVRMDGCFACNVRCKKVVKFEEPYPCDEAYGGPEYETLGALGSNCGVDSLRAICKGNERCNALGLDTISTGSSLAFLMECYERGLITQEETGGIEFRFGDEDSHAQGSRIDCPAREDRRFSRGRYRQDVQENRPRDRAIRHQREGSGRGHARRPGNAEFQDRVHAPSHRGRPLFEHRPRHHSHGDRPAPPIRHTGAGKAGLRAQKNEPVQVGTVHVHDHRQHGVVSHALHQCRPEGRPHEGGYRMEYGMGGAYPDCRKNPDNYALVQPARGFYRGRRRIAGKVLRA